MTDNKLKEIVSRVRSLPSLPNLYHELVNHLEKEETSINKIGEIISRDIGMTAQILHLVNSTYYGLSHRISNITQAVTLLGIDTIRVLVISLHAFSMIRPNVLEKLPLPSLWDHSVNTANIARIISQTETLEKKYEDFSFMGGILHDIGVLILADSFTDKYVEILEKSFRESIPFHEIEYDVYGVTHAEIGGYLLGIWGFTRPYYRGCMLSSHSGKIYRSKI